MMKTSSKPPGRICGVIARGLALGMGALLLERYSARPRSRWSSAAASIRSPSGFRISLVFEFAALLVVLSVVKGIFQYWMRVILIGISRDIEYDLRNDLFSHLVTLSLGFLRQIPHRRHHGARHQRPERGAHDARPGHHVLDRDVVHRRSSRSRVMLSVDWKLTLICLIPAPLVSVAVILFGSRIHDRFETIQKMFSDISSRVQENLSGVRVVRAYAQENGRAAASSSC